MENSNFGIAQKPFQEIKALPTNGGTCLSFLVKFYGKLYFMKRLKPELALNPRYLAAFKKEFETGCMLEHPNLVRYSSLDYDDQGAYMLIDYVEGSTVTEALTSHPDMFLDNKFLQKFTSQVLDCLQYLHSKQILHLDLKPDNILLTRIDADAKIIDLGFCYSDCYSDTQGNTRDFAAPEQLNPDGIPDERTDIYAFGKVLEYISEHSLKPLPTRYQKAIASCLAKDKEMRPRNISQLREMLKPRKNHLLYILPILVALAFAFLYFFSGRETSESLPVITTDTILFVPEKPDTASPIPSAPKEETKTPRQAPVAPKPATKEDTLSVGFDALKSKLHQQIDSLFEVTVISKLQDTKPKTVFDLDLSEMESQYPTLAVSMAQKYPQYASQLILEAANHYSSLVEKLLSDQQQMDDLDNTD